MQKLEAFARTLGYVRYFHPSDQAALVDWETFAFYGVTQILASAPSEPTCALITRLFDPVVIDLDVYVGEEKPRPPTRAVKPTELIAWQHAGVGFEGANFPYQSARMNRPKTVFAPAASYGNVSQSFSVEDHRNKQFRFRFKAKTHGKRTRLYGFVRVDRENGELGFFENMVGNPITGSEWSEHQITGTIDADGKRLLVGFVLFGNGTGFVDAASVEWKQGENWLHHPIKNQGFELGEDVPAGWNSFGRGFDFKIAHGSAAEGKRAGMMFRKFTRDENIGGFLGKFPRQGEVVDAPIGKELRIRMPLALPIDHGKTSSQQPPHLLGSKTSWSLRRVMIQHCVGETLSPKSTVCPRRVFCWTKRPGFQVHLNGDAFARPNSFPVLPRGIDWL